MSGLHARPSDVRGFARRSAALLLPVALVASMVVPTLASSASATDPSASSAPAVGTLDLLSGEEVHHFLPPVVDRPAFNPPQNSLTGLEQNNGVAFDQAGDEFFTGQDFDDNGTSVTEQVVGGGDPQTIATGFRSAFSVATDRAGDVFVGDIGKGTVTELLAGSWTPVTYATGIDNPIALAVDPQGDLYVTDSGVGDVLEFPAGITTPATPPTATVVPGMTGLDEPQGVAVDTAGDVFVSDLANNGEVQELPAGQTTLVSLGTDLSPIAYSLAFDPDGNLLANSADGFLEFPEAKGPAVSLDYTDDAEAEAVYVPAPTFTADTPGALGAIGTPYSYSYSASVPSGEPGPTYRVASGKLPDGLTLDPSTGTLSGDPTAAGTFTFTVQVGNVVTATSSPSTTIVVRPAITVGDVYIADRDNGRVVEEPAGGGPQITLLSGLSGVSGLDVDAAGDLYVGEPGSLQKVPVDGDPAEAVGSGWSEPIAVSVDAAGDVFAVDTVLVSGAYASEAIEVPAAGSPQHTVGSGLKNACGIATDAAGDVYIGDAGNDQVVEVPADGSPQRTVRDNLNDPCGVATDMAGDVWIAGGYDGSIVRIAPDGTLTAPVTGLDEDYDVALGASGQIYYTDVHTNSAGTAPAGGGTKTLIGSGLKEPFGIAVYAPAPTFVKDTPPTSGNVGTTYAGYSYSATSAAGEPDPTYRVSAGALPDGLTLSSDGVLSGTPTKDGTFTFTVQVGNFANAVQGPSTTITVSTTAAFTADTPGDLAAIGTPYSYTYAATPADGETAPAFTVASGKLPTGLTLDPTSGKLSGTPTAGGSYTFTASTGSSSLDATTPSTTITVESPGDTAVTTTTNAEGDGQVQLVPAGGGTPVTVGSGLSFPKGVTTDQAGDLFVAELDNADVVEIPANGGPQKVAVSGVGEPYVLTFDRAGDLFVGTDEEDVIEIPAGGGQRTSWYVAGFVSGIAAERNGKVLVSLPTDYNLTPQAAAIIELDPSTGNQTVVATDGSHDATWTGLALDPYGNAFLADVGTGQILELPAGQSAVQHYASGVSVETAVGLVGIDPAGHVIASDFGGGRLVSFASDGTLTPLATGLSNPNGVAVWAPVPSFVDDTPSTTGTVGTAYSSYSYSASPVVTGEPAATYSVATGALPDGLTLSPAGVLSGVPTKDGQFTFTVQVGNAANATQGPTTTITISPAVVVAPPSSAVLQVTTTQTRTGSRDLNGDTVSGSIYVFANAPANDVEVAFSLDGKVFHNEFTAPWDFNSTAVGNLPSAFSTSTLTDGPHVITATITPKTGPLTVETASFTVSNGTTPPSGPGSAVLQVSTVATRDNPAALDGSRLSGAVYIFAAVDPKARQVVFMLDGNAFHTEASYQFDFNGTGTIGAYPFPTTTLTDGTHTVVAQVTDATGGISTATATFTVANGAGTPPPALSPLQVSILPDRSSPANLDGSRLTGTVYIFDVPTSPAYSVAFSLDGKAFHCEGTAPFDFNGSGTVNALPYSVSALSKGTHTVTALTSLQSGKTVTQTSTFTVY